MSFDLPQIFLTAGAPASTLGYQGNVALDFFTTPGTPVYYLKTGASTWSSAYSLNGTNGAAGASAVPWNILVKSAAYTLTAADVAGKPVLIFADATSGSFAITVDPALLYNGSTTPPTTIPVQIKRVDSVILNSVNIALPSGDNIEGATVAAIPVDSARTLVAKSATTLELV